VKVAAAQTNRVLSFWFEGHNLAVISTTDAKFLKQMKEWAESKGYEVREGTREREES